MQGEVKYGPQMPFSQELHQAKYRSEGEDFVGAQYRFANELADNVHHWAATKDILLNQRFMGGGRTQLAVGSPKQVTAFNCFVSGLVEDDFDTIMQRAREAGHTMRKGGGIGYDFSLLRPSGSLIKSLGSQASGPVSFMDIYNAICRTVSSAGHRRGAQMGVLRIDHPDIMKFITAKNNETELTAFNISVGVTDKFMEAVEADESFDLVFEGVVYETIKARPLWETIMRGTWDWAEPGVLYIDRINEMNNLYWCETIAATNPCGEQPLPPYGACLLGSYNLTKYVIFDDEGTRSFDFAQFMLDIPQVTRMMDNIHDRSIFPLPEQAAESALKRRMGLGVTGLANAVEALGFPYGSERFMETTEQIFRVYRDETYKASVALAKEKGCAPIFASQEAKDLLVKGKFIQTLPATIRAGISEYGLRNSHLLSMAPTGTISLSADNISGGIEPCFSHGFERTVFMADVARIEKVEDYAFRTWGVKGKTAGECTPSEHLAVLALATQYVDSACSKTINVDGSLPWVDFKDIYMQAWKMGCKGCTTFNKDGKRYGILVEKDEPEEEVEEVAKACFIDLQSGHKECS